MNRNVRPIIGAIGALALGLSPPPMVAADDMLTPAWTAPQHYRILLSVDPRGRVRSYSPAFVEIDFQSQLDMGQTFDEHTVEVVASDSKGAPRTFDRSRQGNDRWFVAHRLDRLFGSNNVTLHFVVRDEEHTQYVVYFDTVESRLGKPDRYHGLVGDGDQFREFRRRRETTASHFDQFVDFDGDGDLDLFRGGVEPWVDCLENVGTNRMVSRGRLANGGQSFKLPCSKENRSWLTVAFFDVDNDGDQDFFPSFGDGPDAGTIVHYENTTERHGGQVAFQRIGPLRCVSGEVLAGGAQAGGWFPSIAFVRDWDGPPRGRLDALVGSNHHCWLYRGAGAAADGSPRFADPIAVQAGGKNIQLTNPRFDCADIDGDGDLDLFAGAQPGPVWYFENTGTREQPALAAGQVVAFDGKYLIGDAHSGVKIADFDGDGLLDLAAGRFWERSDLNLPNASRDFGGFHRNTGSRTSPRFVRTAQDAPFSEQFQICDAVRQNSVRAVDWDRDSKSDLLAGDTDGFIWFFRNESSPWFPLFAPAEKIRADGVPLSVTRSGGHARADVCDWNNDGHPDLLVADGQGTLSLFLGERTEGKPTFCQSQFVLAEGKPIHGGARASVLVCDWDHDRKKDIVLADEKGFWWYRNIGTDADPILAASKAITFNGRPVRYVRPNLGSFVDWDGDGKRDLIGCHFENSIRLYRDVASAAFGAEPLFSDEEGVTLVRASSPQMISGADAIDWNGDGDIDLLTGQGHGGSGLRFFERDWIEDELRDAHPIVTITRSESKPGG